MRQQHSRHASLDPSLAKASTLHPFAPQNPLHLESFSAPTSSSSTSSSSIEISQRPIIGGLFSRESRRLKRGSTPRSTFSFHDNNQDRPDASGPFYPIPASSSSTHSISPFPSPPFTPNRPPSQSNHCPPSSSSNSESDNNDDDTEEEEISAIPLSRHEATTESALFAPTCSLSRRKISRLDSKFHREEKERHETGLRKFKAEMEIAVGVSKLYKMEKKEKRSRSREAGNSSRSSSRLSQGKGFEEIEGLFKKVEGGFEGKNSETGEDRLAASGDRPISRRGSLSTGEIVTGAAGVAGVVGLAGLGWEMYRKYEREKGIQLGGELPRPASAPATSPTTSRNRTSPFALAQSIPRPLSTLPPPSSSSPRPIFISHLTPSQHKTLQHAAAALLLKHHERHKSMDADVGKTYHYDEIGLVVGAVEGGWKEITELVEKGLGKVGGRSTHRLFGVDLKELTKHEGISSTHGIDPHAKGLRIPEFLDHLITALKQSDMSIPGILRKSGNVRQILQIIDSLDHADGSNETVLDLAKLDPITLANLFTKFLTSLPHPVFTHHLFGLFIATSHIHHPGLRRRAMHLVICLMPKVNRDVMEVVFLFLTWLHRHIHLSVIDGQSMDLTGIATIMAPILLSPKNRQPHRDELKSMIAAVLNLLEDQHVLHEIPLELAHLLHIEPPKPTTGGSHDVSGFIKHLFERL